MLHWSYCHGPPAWEQMIGKLTVQMLEVVPPE